MLRRPARTTACAAALTGLIVLSGCSAFDEKSGGAAAPSDASDTARPSGCDGPAAPAYAGRATGFDEEARVEAGQAVGARVSTPVLSTKSAGIKGWAIAELPIKAEVVTNGVFAVGPDSFVLVDPAGKQCARPKSNPLTSPLGMTEVDEKRPGKGSVAFLVPQGAPLSRYKVLYNGKGGSTAEAAWSATGAAGAESAARSCSTTKSTLALEKGGPSIGFGKAATFGDADTVGHRVTVGVPAARPLQPSERHPNNVDGVALTVRVEAIGSVAFVDRNMFQLTDGAGTVCGYSQLGTEGENLTSDLVQVGKPKTYTMIFWVPKGSHLKGWKATYRHDTNASNADAAWS
ncbi:hypothetical protein PZ938_12180 [Luteipulveratus sp. YIM 133132]|uniref:hypothetical protein n=1 Tax=Luteipulveratus flavus TaxID=3031728 RepID=UPI0023AE927E|nr:hypothetical protein [Luteipulveratus sp. YIM 133132]MDE9366360.1 hypothetical protein [Luteipulveratus sp. YIM 133132]